MASDDDKEKGPPPGGDEKRVHRRGFFREGFRQLLKPLSEIVEQRLERVGLPFQDEDTSAYLPSGGGSPASSDLPRDRPVLRPPGALPEEEFLERCLSSGQCVNVCPVNAIRLARSDDPRLDGKPFIDPQVQACVVCEDLACMHVCPSGALVPVPREEIRMGIAVVRDELCVRTGGEDCQICVDKCPLGPAAIDIPYPGAPVEVKVPGCVGCGVCEMYCPTEPRAIVVEPFRGGEGEGGYGARSSGEGVGEDGYLPLD